MLTLLRLIVAGSLLMATSLPAAPPARPNILWISADDFAPYVCGAYGNTLVRTPNLDRLAKTATRFDRAFCNAPVCTASRQSFLTGRYPRTIGVTQLKTPLPESETTLAELLKAAGYQTAAFGKMHFNSDLKHGFDQRLDLPDHRKWLQAKGAKPLPESAKVQPPWKPFKDPARIWLNSDALAFGAVDEDMPGTWLAEQAAEFLSRQTQENEHRPFFLMVSFYEPHSPFHFPVEFAGRIVPEKLPVFPVDAADEPQIPEIFRVLTPREKQGIGAAYYTSVEFLDRNVGLVLEALEKSGRDRDTIVVFTGDHGYMLGQHGRFEKHCCFEPAVRAALMIRVPGVDAPASTKALVEFIDVAPTLLAATGIEILASIQGRSLLPLLKKETEKHREQVFVEYSENAEAMVRTDRWKLVYGAGNRQREDGYATGRPLPGRTIRLYDLESDPDERHDLSNDPAQALRVDVLTHALADHLVRTARQPELLPETGNVHELLDFCVQPRDVPK